RLWLGGTFLPPGSAGAAADRGATRIAAPFGSGESDRKGIVPAAVLGARDIGAACVAAVRGPGAADRSASTGRRRHRRSPPRSPSHRSGDHAAGSPALVLHDLRAGPAGAGRGRTPGRPRTSSARPDGAGRPRRESGAARAPGRDVAGRDPR